MLDEISVIVINHRTIEHSRQCVESFRLFYPTVKMILIDNGSDDNSCEYISSTYARDPYTTILLNESNLFHGPAMDQGIKTCSTRFVFTLDSDCEIKKSGFLELTVESFSDPNIYAVGKLVRMDPFGYEIDRPSKFCFPYIHPRHMLLDRHKYLQLKPFIHHGSPCIQNMRHAIRKGYILRDFPIGDYIYHKGRGTCSQYGYGLGLRHTLENILHHGFTALFSLRVRERN